MRRTGVIVGIQADISMEQTKRILDHCNERFPHVTFAVCGGGATSIAFEWDEPEPTSVAFVWNEPEQEQTA